MNTEGLVGKSYAVIFPDKDEHIWSGELYDLMGVDPAEVVPSYETLKASIHPDDLPGFDLALTRLANNEPVEPSTVRVLLREDTVKCVFHFDTQVLPNRPTMMLIQVYKSDSLKSTIEQLQHSLNKIGGEHTSAQSIQEDPQVIERVSHHASIGWWERDRVTGQLQLSDMVYTMLQEKAGVGWYEYDLLNPANSKFSDQWLLMHDFDSKQVPTEAEYLDKLHPRELEEIRDVRTYLRRMPAEWDKLEMRIITRSGDTRCISNSSRVIFEDGEPVKVFGVTTDVTDIRNAQRALYQNERKYRLLSETSRDVIFLLEGEAGSTTIGYVSDSVTAMLGYDKSELLGRSSRVYVHPDDRAKYLNDSNYDLTLGEVIKMELRLLKKDNTYLWVEALANSFVDGKSTKIRLSVRDISERKEHEERLIKANNDLNALIRATENLVFIIDKEWRFEGVIANDESKLHIPAKDFINRPVKEIWSDRNGLQLQKMVNRAFEHGQSGVLEYPYTLRGKRDWYKAQVHAFRGHDGEPRVSVVIETITVQKKAEQEVQKTLEMERELSRMRTNFVSMASHQFRTPLTVIKSNMQLLDLAKLENPLVSRVSGRLVKEVDRLVLLMEDILILGKVQTESLKATPEKLDMYHIMEDIANDVELGNDTRKLVLQKRGEPEAFYGDHNLMRHAILNIVTNAFKYSQGRPSPEALIDYRGDEIRIHVKDYGIGIHPDDHKRIFKDFFRADNVRDIPGTGLGMSITLEFLRLNKCDLVLESELNEGSTFTIILPKKPR